ncbi:transmembrane protein 116 [Nothobranchius furzeri]|uniref:Transmembrane protein 116 n=1 Tax=Nothobranchius furzeri TaxID=105023 RepID=A0A9D2YTA4_NOTFU|nr:transmembrane protein 116 [Nothobranchius furzeri]
MWSSEMQGFTNSSNVTTARDWTKVYKAVQWIQLIMALCSILGSSSIIFCLISQRLRKKPELQPLFLLSVTDLLLALCWLVGAVLFSQRCSNLNTLCYNLHTVEQVLYMASFFYTLNYVWNLYTTIREKFHSCYSGYSVQFSNRVKTSAKVIALSSWLLVMTVMMEVDEDYHDDDDDEESSYSDSVEKTTEVFGFDPHDVSTEPRCLLMHTGALYLTSDQLISSSCSLWHTYQIIVFLSTFLLTLLSTSVMVVRARRIYRRVVSAHGYLGNEQRTLFQVMDRRMILYPLVFVLCWGPAVTLALLRVFRPLTHHGLVIVVLYILQALTAASQGFLNCLVYGWTCAHLRRASLKFFLRDVDTQTPLLRSQRSKGYQSLRSVA